VRAFSAVGHTPGHAVYAFTSNGQELWCIGDLIHFSLQFLHPSIGVVFDSEGKQAIASRLELFKKAAAGHIILAGAHLPNIVTLTAKGEGYEANAMEGK
jgi:glyoxylase-like metal-dependent hydrolase (beta-lactamase superfamily II)